MRHLRILAALVVLAIPFAVTTAQQPSLDAIAKRFAQAEAYYAEGSYERAHRLYLAVDLGTLQDAERRWVAFRTADSRWRAAAANPRRDNPDLVEAELALDKLIDDSEAADQRDRIWAEAQESLGDLHTLQQTGSASEDFQAALDFWAESSDIELARRRYLGIVWKMAAPFWREAGRGHYGHAVPPEVLENALKIAVQKDDRSRAAYMLAVALRQRGDAASRDRIEDVFEIALQAGRSAEWYDDALFNYATWLEESGRAVEGKNGQWRYLPDYEKALTLYRRLLSEFRQGESRYLNDARRRHDAIIAPSITLSMPGIFVPGSEVEFQLHTRNVAAVDFELTAIDLGTDGVPRDNDDLTKWMSGLRAPGSRPFMSWRKEIEDAADHAPHGESIRLERDIPRGAYILTARSGEVAARELVLVSDATVVLKSSPRQALVFVADAVTGAPVAGARVQLFDQRYGSNAWGPIAKHETIASADGLARFDLVDSANARFLVIATKGDRQAFAQAFRNRFARHGEGWRIYSLTDRPAYRPNETVHWKITARLFDGLDYASAAGRTLQYDIVDPRGAKVASGTATLNDFGSFWSDLPLTTEMPLGQYHITFHQPGDKRHVGSAALFRLEEYKLPEYVVRIETPQENGRPKVFRLGDRVNATVRAKYYFGGGVPNANAEITVTQRPLRPFRPLRQHLGWSLPEPPRQYYGGGEVVFREVVRTDAEGKAEISFDTPRGAQSDFEYVVVANVTDASRREVSGSATVRVSRQGYFVTATPDHYLHRPGAKATIDFQAHDVNEQPMAVTGTVRVIRQTWREVWRDPEGKRVEGAELERVRSRHAIFPPPGGGGWVIERRTPEEDEILVRSVTTDDEGKGSLSFTPDRDGYYRIVWTSDDRRDPSRPKRPSDVVRAETAIWVVSATTKRLGYHQDGLEIIVDSDTFRAGQPAHVMIVAPMSGAHVLFGVEAEEILETRLLKLEGDAKLVEIPVDEKHVPNVFITAHAVSDLQLLGDTERVVVPPTRNFVDVTVKTDADEVLPGAKGQLTVTTRDAEGRPIAAEVALSVADLSVEAIQSVLSIDPKAFFYGSTRQHFVRTTSSFEMRPYLRLAPREKERAEGSLDKAEDAAAKRREGFGAAEGGVVGGVVSQSAVAEAITVTANAPPPPPPPAAAPMRESSAGDEVIAVRSDFRSTALWIPDVKTGESGTATVDVSYPESLTTWKATATAVTTGNAFGRGTTTSRTRKPLMVRLQSPRFLVVGDEATISAVVNNSTASPMQVTVAADLSGIEIVRNAPATVEVPANGDARVDWTVRASAAGAARLRVSGRATGGTDAMERTIPLFEHGIDKLVAVSGKTRGTDTTGLLDIPADRRRESTELIVQVTPSLAVTMLDALPYLVEFPYGCTEQTMSRFLPAVITLKTLGDLGLSREEAASRIFGGIEKATAAATHAGSARGVERLDAVMRASLARLRDFQHGDGGWGWWKEGDSDPYMTGYVVWGLALAREAGVSYRGEMLDRGVRYLQTALVEREGSVNEQAWMLHALAAARKGAPPQELESKAIENVWKQRDDLRPYSRALFALALHSWGATERATVMVRNLENGAAIDRTPDQSIVSRGGSESTAQTLATARWGERGFWWRWWDGPVESTALALRALVTIDPRHPLVEPAMNWLVKNRRGSQWSSTKETAIAVLALNDYLRRSGELSATGAYEVRVNGTSIAKQAITPATILSAPSRYRVDAALVRDGRNEVQILRSGGGADVYFAAEARFFSLEEPVTAAGNQLFVRREYFRLAGQPTLLAGYVYDRVPLRDGDSIASGERIEVVATIETKNELEYLIFEDLKPAGFEAVELQSGHNLVAKQLRRREVAAATPPASAASRRSLPPGFGLGSRVIHQELRDRKVAMFADRLEQGVWEIRYTLRAETPGTFHALPLLGAAMYVPEIRANGEETRVRVTE